MRGTIWSKGSGHLAARESAATLELYTQHECRSGTIQHTPCDLRLSWCAVWLMLYINNMAR